MNASTVIGLVEVVTIGFLVLGAIAFVLWFFARLGREEEDS